MPDFRHTSLFLLAVALALAIVTLLATLRFAAADDDPPSSDPFEAGVISPPPVPRFKPERERLVHSWHMRPLSRKVPGGLVGPGGVGNYLVTGHRSSSTAPFRSLPSLRVGALVVVVTDTHRLVYEVVGTRRTSFRSERSLREQSAAVPGRPGLAPTRAMITLSTCATFEDHAAGNYWSDEFHNPEHRIEKIGVLRSVRPL